MYAEQQILTPRVKRKPYERSPCRIVRALALLSNTRTIDSGRPDLHDAVKATNAHLYGYGMHGTMHHCLAYTQLGVQVNYPVPICRTIDLDNAAKKKTMRIQSPLISRKYQCFLSFPQTTGHETLPPRAGWSPSNVAECIEIIKLGAIANMPNLPADG